MPFFCWFYHFLDSFVGSLVQTMTPKGHFEINWPLNNAQKFDTYRLVLTFLMEKLLVDRVITLYIKFPLIFNFTSFKKFHQSRVSMFFKGGFVSESAIRFTKSPKKISQKTILNLKFKIPAHNSIMLWAGILNFKLRIVFGIYIFLWFGDLKNTFNDVWCFEATLFVEEA